MCSRELETCTELQPCLFGKVRIIVSYLPCELWCYLYWPFPLQVTGCGSAGEHRSGSMIRPDQNCRVCCSRYHCHTHQTVRCPHQVWRSSRTQGHWRWRVTQALLRLSYVSADLRACLHTLLCRAGEQACRMMRACDTQCKWISPEQLSH